MFNVLLDGLPTQWEGYPINSDFRTGVQLSQVFQDETIGELEKVEIALELFFEGVAPQTQEEILSAITWYLNGWFHDKANTKSSTVKTIDFDVDQWRIYSAFREQYGINLNIEDLHYWEFMGMLTTLQECAFTRVIDIRQKKITSKMSKEEKKAISEAKKIYTLGQVEKAETPEETKEKQEALELFNKLRNS